jgi:transcriptional regulator of arginine metabolism
MKTKNERLDAISLIIRTEKIRNQEELLKRLHENGFAVTQATLSRDIKQLKIARVHDEDNAYVYRPVDTPATALPQEKHIPSLEFSGSLAVIKTRPGYAMGIASDIDSCAPQEILATIAGDDTILVVPREGYTREDIAGAINRFIC